MKYKALLVFLFGLLVSSCMNMRQYSNMYFLSGQSSAGVESRASFVNRMMASKNDRELLLGGKKIAKTQLVCSLLRNQLFAAARIASGGADAQNIKASAKRMEDAYQSGDREFMQACKVEMDSEVGRFFWRLNYVMRERFCDATPRTSA